MCTYQFYTIFVKIYADATHIAISQGIHMSCKPNIKIVYVFSCQALQDD